MRAVLADGALTDTAACGGHRDVQAAEAVDGLLQHLLGAREVGDVHLVEGAADRFGHLFAIGLRPVQHRYAGTPLGQRLCGRPPKARCPAHDDGFLARDLHLNPFPKSA